MIVLAIQHDRNRIEILSEAFRKCGATGVFCNSAKSGMEILANSHCDLVIIDLASAGSDGMYALRRIREDNRTRDIPVIVIDANNSEISLIQSSLLAVSEYLVPPLSADTLAQKIKLLNRISLLTREVNDKSLLSNIIIEERRGVTAFRFSGHFSHYSVLQFQNIYTPAYRQQCEGEYLIFNFTGVPVFSRHQIEPFRLVCEMVLPKRTVIIAGTNFGALMPLVSEPQSCLFMNEQDAMEFLEMREQIS